MKRNGNFCRCGPSGTSRRAARDTLSGLKLRNRRAAWLQREPLLPFPQMHEDPVREQIDDAVIIALDLDAEWVASVWRELVAMDRRRGSRPQ